VSKITPTGALMAAGAWGLGQALKVGVGIGAGAAQGALTGAKVIGKAGLGVAGAVGKAGVNMAEGAGIAVVESARNPQLRSGILSSWGTMAGNFGKKFMKVNDKGELKMTKFGIGTFIGAGMLNNSRDIYDKEKARRMGEIDNNTTSLTPRMSVPQYEFNPRKRMGALDGGASGDLVFALHNNR